MGELGLLGQLMYIGKMVQGIQTFKRTMKQEKIDLVGFELET